MTTFKIVNTPAFTTATAWSSALTGVGATIAAGSQRWNGISAALPVPNANNASNKPTARGLMSAGKSFAVRTSERKRTGEGRL